jgi:hypothetical protein
MTHGAQGRKATVEMDHGPKDALDATTPAGAARQQGVACGRAVTPWKALHAVALIAVLGVTRGAMASEGASPGEDAGVRTWEELESGPRLEQRPFAFVEDPSTPSRGTLALGYTLGVGSGISADRPIPVVLQSAGLSNQLSLGYGVTSWFEPMVEMTATSSDGSTVASATLGMKFQLTSPDSPWRAAVLTGALREGASGAYGMWVRGAGSWGTGPLLVEVNGYVERVFASGRDSVDYAVMGGASWRLFDGFRAGGEYVGQDLEEMGAGGAEGGARQAVGPNVAFDVDRGRYQIVAATLFGVGALSPTALVRVGLLGSF